MSRKRDHKPEPLDPEMSPAVEPETVPDKTLPDGDREAATGEGSEEGGLAREIENLAIALEQRTKEAAEANEKYLRTYADFENYRKRMQRDQADFRKYANEQMALELLSVIDHLGLAIRHANESAGTGEGLQQGVEMVYKQFQDILEKFGIVPFSAEGQPFDPAIHEAMMQVETADVPENTVVQVFQEGYRYHEKVLRHAKVGVSKKPAGGAGVPQPAEADEESEE